MTTLRRCRIDDPFYADADRVPEAEATFLPDPPSDWLVANGDDWRSVWPVTVPARTHGWKIHVSSTEQDYAAVLNAVARVCFRLATPFKHVTSKSMVRLFSAKDADRGSASKHVTIYPMSDMMLDRLTGELDAEIGGLTGPYILGDVRFRSGPLHFRFGAFMPFSIFDDQGRERPARPGPTAVLEPDPRRPLFVAPEGEAPGPVKEAIEAYLSDPTPGELGRFAALQPVQFSNAGGVYLATANDGRQTILKEARPHAGLDAVGRDAVARLHQEWRNLGRLDGLGLGPKPLARFTEWEHSFIEMELLSGTTLADRTIHHLPSLNPGASPHDYRRYAETSLLLLREIEQKLAIAHDHGVVVGDLHPRNVMVLQDDRVRFIDLEDAREPLDSTDAPFNALGYAAPDGFTAAEADWFALSRVAASVFRPDFAREILAPAAWQRIVATIGEDFGAAVPEYIASLELRFPDASGPRALRPRAQVAPPATLPDSTPLESRSPAALRFVDGLIAAWQREPVPRTPGHPASNPMDNLSYASGTAGVVAAIHRAGGSIPDSMVGRLDVTAHLGDVPLGLLDGVAGVAATFREIGRHVDAEHLEARIHREHPRVRSCSLASGLAGLCRYFARHAIDHAVDLADLLAKRTDDPDGPFGRALDARPGLMHGWSGLSLAFADMAQRTGEERFADRAQRALELESRHIVRTDGRIVGLQEVGGRRSFPYLENGTAGLLIALARLREVRVIECDHPLWRELSGELARSCSGGTFVFDGLLRGGAGVLIALNTARPWIDAAGPAADRLWQTIIGNALELDGTLQFAGDDLLRLSTDVGTGSAGILLAGLSHGSSLDNWLPGATASGFTDHHERR